MGERGEIVLGARNTEPRSQLLPFSIPTRILKCMPPSSRIRAESACDLHEVFINTAAGEWCFGYHAASRLLFTVFSPAKTYPVLYILVTYMVLDIHTTAFVYQSTRPDLAEGKSAEGRLRGRDHFTRPERAKIRQTCAFFFDTPATQRVQGVSLCPSLCAIFWTSKLHIPGEAFFSGGILSCGPVRRFTSPSRLRGVGYRPAIEAISVL